MPKKLQCKTKTAVQKNCSAKKKCVSGHGRWRRALQTVPGPPQTALASHAESKAEARTAKLRCKKNCYAKQKLQCKKKRHCKKNCVSGHGRWRGEHLTPPGPPQTSPCEHVDPGILKLKLKHLKLQRSTIPGCLRSSGNKSK